MNNLDKQYQTLLQTILDYGIVKSDRTGTGTKSIFGYTIRHNMKEGFPLITTKKMPFRLIVTELLWFLRGDTNIKYLVDNDCHIWDGDAFKNFMNKSEGDPDMIWNQEQFIHMIKTDDTFANKWGDLGPIYGAQWRAFGGYNKVPSGWTHGSVTSFKEVAKCDQFANLIADLKTNPDSRRLMVTAWNPAELDKMTLPPCHYGFQVYTRELSREERIQIYVNQYMGGVGKPAGFEDAKLTTRNIPTRAISLMFNMRSTDVPLGLPFNLASYGLLLEILAKEVNMFPDELIANLGDTHIYVNQIEQAKEQIGTKLTHEERQEMLKEAMGSTKYQFAIQEQVPFSGGLSEYYDIYKIPYRTREPYPLPTLKHMKTDEFYKSLSEDLTLLTHLDNTDFVVENYQSHPHIKTPLSN
jgi:thymidylate synthase